MLRRCWRGGCLLSATQIASLPRKCSAWGRYGERNMASTVLGPHQVCVHPDLHSEFQQSSPKRNPMNNQVSMKI